MPRLPHRQSLPSQTAEIIVEMIESGEFTDFLPGERSLANKLQIGRDTLRSALDILESQNLISPREHGKRRSVSSHKQVANPQATRRIAFLSPKSVRELPPRMLVEVDTLRELLNNRDYELELLTPGIFHLQNPSRQLERFLKDEHFDAWILYQCPLSVQRWFQEQQLPCIIRGYSNEGIDIPCIDEDWQASAFHAGNVLTRHGHRSIGLLIPDTQLAGLIATEAGLRQAVETSDIGGKVHLLIDNVEQGSVHRALERAFKLDSPPTAIIGSRSRHTITVMSWMAQHGLSIPKNLSYISLAYEEWYTHITPPITHYHSDPSTFARSIVRKIIAVAERGKTQPLKRLIPEYFEGRSVRTL